jgi:hypothetical protein
MTTAINTSKENLKGWDEKSPIAKSRNTDVSGDQPDVLEHDAARLRLVHLLFQPPWLPEMFMRRNDFATLRRLFREGPARHSSSQEDDVQFSGTLMPLPNLVRLPR